MFYRLTNSGNNLFDELARVGSEIDELFGRTAWPAHSQTSGSADWFPQLHTHQ